MPHVGEYPNLRIQVISGQLHEESSTSDGFSERLGQSTN